MSANHHPVDFERITLDHLRRLAKKLSPDRPELERSLAFSSAVTNHYLGAEWLKRHVVPTSKYAAYLRVDVDASLDEKRITFPRFFEFAETLLNLQDVEGFGSFLHKLKTDNVEACCAELDVARLLAVHELRFEFVAAQGRRGSDYDFEVFYPDDLMVHTDAKCKFEDTAVDLKSVRNSLNKAAKQFPKGEPAVVIVKVPSHWINDDAIRQGLVATAEEFLRGKQRVVSVKFYAIVPVVTETHSITAHIYREVSNPSAPFPVRNWDMFRDFPRAASRSDMPPWWVKLYPAPTCATLSAQPRRR